ncbi:MAG: putative toxin-antitoxin system toxin component, PIN family [Terracidiphilus sp.]|jgi:putative PIN family toxin of toxin-antitoxin system
MPDPKRLVIDTNVVLSGLLFPGSTSSRALLRAQSGEVLASDATLLELVEVMSRARFDRYVELSIRQRLVAEFANACETLQIVAPIRACRDPKDDKFLEVAVHGRAELIVTGDEDLLVLNPFRGIAILTPAQYLEME